MKLTAQDISSRLAADFGGSLLFQPLYADDTDTQRPVALLASVAQLLPVPLAPFSRAAAVLRNPMFDLLHHDPAAVRHKH